MMHSLRWTTAALAVCFFGTVLAAQGQQGQAGGRQGGPPPQRNLTVLPADIETPRLIQIMQGFEGALGVTCEHCHVYLGRGNPMNDFASDAKQPKKTARIMIQGLRDFNMRLASSDLGKPAADVVRVQCGTCHRGKAIPDYVPPPLPEPAARGGGAGRQGGQ